MNNIVLFARNYQLDLFSRLDYQNYNPVYVVMSKVERKQLEKTGCKVAACFEDDFDSLECDELDDNYLMTSLFSDRYFGGLDISKRRYLLKKEKVFWSTIFDNYKPICLLNEVVAIEISEVMLIEAKKRNIPYFAWLVSPFKNRQFYWVSSPFNSSLNPELFQNKVSEQSLSECKEYADSITVNDRLKPFYVKNLIKRKSPIIFIKNLYSLFRCSIKKFEIRNEVKRLACYFNDAPFFLQQLRLYIASFIYNYKRIENYEDYELVFYPLHFEPEASITYFSEFYEDQIALIKNLSKCLKLNQILVIKEHPQQPGMLLSKKFRQLRNQLSNINYVPAENPTRELIKKASIVITQTSTAGWEALFFNKPVVVIGKVYYDKYEKINVFQGFEKLRDDIRMNKLKVSDRNSITNYAAKFHDYCCYGNITLSKNLYERENISNISKALMIKIRQIKNEK